MGRRIGRLEQTGIYVGKCWRLFINEKQWKNLISTLIITVLISFVTSEKTFEDYVQTKNSCFAIVCACIWVGIFNSIQSICRERSIIKREHRTGLHISSYIGAHVIFEAALGAVEALIVLVIVLINNKSHLPESGLIFPLAVDMYITLYLTIFASDMMAIGAIRTLRERGLRVPDDVALVGFDDAPMARHSDPPLTTIHQPIQAMSEKAVEVLLAQKEGKKTGERFVFPASLCVRETTRQP